MANTTFQSIDEYIAAQPKRAQNALRKVRRIIRSTVPNVEEYISYHMPTFRIAPRVGFGLAAWKDHYSLYPAGADLIAEFHDEITPYLSGKSTLKFSLAEPVPERLIARI